MHSGLAAAFVVIASCGSSSPDTEDDADRPDAASSSDAAADAAPQDDAAPPEDAATPEDASTDDSGAPNVQTIGPAGGELAIEGATLTVPAGALSSDIEITIEEDTDFFDPAFRPISPVFRFLPAGTMFNSPVTVAIDYDTELATYGTPVFYHSSAGDEETLEVVADAVFSDGTGTAMVSHFSHHLVGYVCGPTTVEFASFPGCGTAWTESGVNLLVTASSAMCTCDASNPCGSGNECLAGYCFTVDLNASSLPCGGFSTIQVDFGGFASMDTTITFFNGATMLGSTVVTTTGTVTNVPGGGRATRATLATHGLILRVTVQ